MAQMYFAQNHDWDLTLRASHDLLMAGLHMNKLQRTGTLERGFSYFTGSMLLSFCSIESISASTAFLLPDEKRFASFDFKDYQTTTRFWDKIELLSNTIGFPLDKSQGLFHKIAAMQKWRNLVTHASPYKIEATQIENTVKAPSKLHNKFRTKEYTRIANQKTAKEFYSAAYDYIDLLKEYSGIEPRASATYKI